MIMMEVLVFAVIVLVFGMGGILYLVVSGICKLVRWNMSQRKETIDRSLPDVIFTYPTTTTANQEESTAAFLDGCNTTDLTI